MKHQSTKFTIYLALLFVGFVFNHSAAAQNTTATLTFSGLQNGEEVREFYNGGAGSLGSTGGTNYGISFVINRIGAPSGNVETEFTTPQLRNTIRGITINVPNGFTTQVFFRYSRPGDMTICTADVWSDLSLTGTRLANQNLPITGGNFDTAGRPVTTVTFSGTGRSLEFFCGGSFLAIDDIIFNTAAAPTANQTLRYADFDGDGKTDISVYRSGTWFVNPSGAPNAAFGVQFGQAGDSTVPVDYDGDGKSDIAVWRPGNGFFYILNSQTNTVRAERFGQNGDNPTVSGDWDNDGKADLAVYRGGAQSFFYYRPSAQPNVSVVSIPWGTSGDTPIFGDFDGDRRLDAAIYRPNNNTFYVRQSSNGASLARQWGKAQTDAIFAGDFDGDGKSDFAVQRFSGADAGTWYVAQSGGTTRTFQWGLGSDVPVPADYDGDGRMDFAVFRRSNGTWYINRSGSGAAQYSVFGATSDFPLPLNLVR